MEIGVHIVVNALQLVLAVALYMAILQDNGTSTKAKEKEEAKNTAKNIFSEEDEDLLGDLGLDFYIFYG